MKNLKDWLNYEQRPLLVSGPCSAESEEQLLQIALELKEHPVSVMRAGIWKPRTRPDSFEGMGTIALKWLRKAGTASGLKVAVEVANTKHVEEALKEGIDILWIGARSTVSPFIVQEIADALKGTNTPVLVKNPVNPDIDLWVGAIERILNSGIDKVVAVHRGFSSYENSSYRNKPNWEIPIELRRRIPGIPILCDPSHICGNTFMLQYVSQFAMDLNYDGLMIETHNHPEKALSDSKQQITPAQLGELLNKLVLRNFTVDDVFELSKLEDLRDQIDEIDDEIIETLAKRMSVARLIGVYKKKNNVTILQPERWNEIIATRTSAGMEKQLTREFLLKLYDLIHQESIYQQTLQMNKEENPKEKVFKQDNA